MIIQERKSIACILLPRCTTCKSKVGRSPDRLVIASTPPLISNRCPNAGDWVWPGVEPTEAGGWKQGLAMPAMGRLVVAETPLMRPGVERSCTLLQELLTAGSTQIASVAIHCCWPCWPCWPFTPIVCWGGKLASLNGTGMGKGAETI